MGLLGILLGLALLMWLAYRGWSVLLVSPAAALLAAAISGEPLLAHWTHTFMQGAARFIAQWFPMFLLGGLFGKLMDDSGSIQSIARFLTDPATPASCLASIAAASRSRFPFMGQPFGIVHRPVSRVVTRQISRAPSRSRRGAAAT